ncbi:hypothetical protein LDJ79_00965 [Vibrio tritonius]|uniref:Lipoprotein n=1 Tax=Vibrio tritonius TaxID=1435069 RepID=A0ABS7YK66_9VIBR|nr:hypothetical protein [Vibrio tritonius]MCA2014660.1 hypothetical protein [Vibrio tritonius]
MKPSNLTIVAMLVSSISGCATHEASAPKPIAITGSMNQPTLTKLAATTKNQAGIPTKSNAQTTSMSTSKLQPRNAEDVLDDKVTKLKGEHKPVSYIAESAKYVSLQTQISDYYIFQGETYEEALSRWLVKSDFQTIGKLLTPDTQLVLHQRTTDAQILHTTFDEATRFLLDQAIEKARKNSKDETDGWISTDGKKSLYIRLHLNQQRHQAIISSSHLPVTLFEVKKGYLRDNFMRLGAFYGWKADKEFYLPNDPQNEGQYIVSFGYPIVTEQGNIKAALNMLLRPYRLLEGAVVPSTREIYVISEGKQQ